MRIHSGFLGPGATWDPLREATPFRLRGFHPLCRAFQCPSTITRLSDSLLGRQSERKGPTTPYTQRLPALTRVRFGLIRFRSPLLTEYLFLPVLRCFTSRRSLHAPYIFRCGSLDMTPAGFPHSEILGSRFVCQLPEAYRRLLRPSSAPSAKASTLCPYKLDHKNYKDARVHCAVLKLRTIPVLPGAYPSPTHAPRADKQGTVHPDPTDPCAATLTPHARRPQVDDHRDDLRVTRANRPQPVPSGPNSVPNRPPHQPHPFHPRVNPRSTKPRPADEPAIVDVPPVSSTPVTDGPSVGLDIATGHEGPTRLPDAP